jgi:hypothetical protein
MDETSVHIRVGLHYLYRAVDKHGKSIASLLRPDKGVVIWPRTLIPGGAISGVRSLQISCDLDDGAAIRATSGPRIGRMDIAA